jgi:hypothetical protein
VNDKLLLAVWRYLVPVPRRIWQGQVRQEADLSDGRLGFMTDEHHLVRDFVVRELPRVGEPLAPDLIAQALGLPLAQVVAILDELEKHKTFLYRNPQGAVTWAYPVTVDVTPHHVTLSTGEQVYAA